MAKANETTAPEKAPAAGPSAPAMTGTATAPVIAGVPTAAAAKRWKVSLPWLPPYVVEAPTADAAVEVYKATAGIIETEHQFGVEAA